MTPTKGKAKEKSASASSGEVSCFDGKKGGVTKVKVDATIFGDKVRPRLLRQAFLHYAAAHRAGTHDTLTRAEVNFNQRKPWKQKGTGRARSGDSHSPVWRHGGIAHGPHPRKYLTGFTRGMRREALRSALLGKLNDGELCLMSGFALSTPKTKEAAALLKSLGVDKARTLVVVADRTANTMKSFRNIENVSVVVATDLNAEHVMLNTNVVMDQKALELVQARLSNA